MEPTYFKMFCWFCVLMYINCSDMTICKLYQYMYTIQNGTWLLPFTSSLLLN